MNDVEGWLGRVCAVETEQGPEIRGIGGIDIENSAATAENTLERHDHRKAFVTTDTLRRRYLAIPGRIATSARRVHLYLPSRWPWAERFLSMLDAIRSVELVT